MVAFSIQSLINAEVRRKESHTPNHWSPSKLGSCLCGVYLERLGERPDEEFDDRTLRVFSAGKMFEDWVVGLVRKSGVTVQTQTEAFIPELDARGFLDILVGEGDQQVIYEIKSKNSKAFWYMEKKGEGPNEQHMMQLWFYLEALKVNEGRLLYIEKDTLTTLEYVLYRNNEEIGNKVRAELELLNRAWKEKIPPKPRYSGWQAKYCRYHQKCLAQEKYIE